MTLMFSSFHSHLHSHSHPRYHFHLDLLEFFDSSGLPVKIVSDKSLYEFNNSFCLGVQFFKQILLRFLVRLMYSNLFKQIFDKLDNL